MDHASQSRRPRPLVERLLGQEAEVELVRSLRGGVMMEEHRTAAPWCSMNQISYLEAPRQDDGLRPLHAAVELNKRKVLARILEGRARPDLVDHRGRSALMIAAAWGFTDTLELLLKHGASHAVRDNSGRQALHYAVRTRENIPEVIQILLAARADIDARDGCGTTPLMGASLIQSRVAVDALLKHRASSLEVDYVGQRALDYAKLRLPGQHPETAPAELNSALEARTAVSPSGSKRYTINPRGANSRYRRWDEMGRGVVEKALIYDERRLWERATPCLPIADYARLECGLPKIL